jgi:hypothetical protein
MIAVGVDVITGSLLNGNIPQGHRAAMTYDAGFGLDIDGRINLGGLGRKRNRTLFIINSDFQYAGFLGYGLDNPINALPLIL